MTLVLRGSSWFARISSRVASSYFLSSERRIALESAISADSRLCCGRAGVAVRRVSATSAKQAARSRLTVHLFLRRESRLYIIEFFPRLAFRCRIQMFNRAVKFGLL